MSGNQEGPHPVVLVQDASLPQRIPSPNLGVEAPIQNSQDGNSAQETHIQSTPVPANYPIRSSSASQGSDLISAQRSFTSLSSKVAQGKHSLTREHAPASSRVDSPRRSYTVPGGYYLGYDDGTRTTPAGQNTERRQSRVSFNLNNQRSRSNPSPSGGSPWPDDDDDDDESSEDNFNDRAIRHAFIRKVYLLIMCMMIFATGVISFMMFHTPTRLYVIRTWWLIIVAWAAYPILIIALLCCESLRRSVPINYVMLFLVTLVLSIMAGCSAAHFEKYEVLGAFGITAAVCLGLTIFAWQTKLDFTVISGGLMVASIILLIFGIVLIFWRNKIAMIAYSCLGAFLGCMFFIFDTQMMMGGNHKYAISPEEYVFAAITLFTDMINIFLMILNIIGLSRN